MPRTKKVTLECVGQVAPDRLADLEFLIREKTATCTIRFEGEWAELFDDAGTA